jgi:anti-sigma factor ChrR (cupin superfamily)
VKPIDDTDRLVANHREATFTPSLAAPGGSILQLDESNQPGVGFHLYRMEPGTVTAVHRHTSDEQFFVVEGDLADHDGHEYRIGDLVLLNNGTTHNSSTQGGCLLAVFIATPEENISTTE